MTPLVVVAILPGEPHAQKRARSRTARSKTGKSFVMHYDHPESRSWKGTAQVHYQSAMQALGIAAPAFAGDVQISVEAVFELPKSKHRKRDPRARRPYEGSKDVDNVLKAVMDAGKGLLWLDDRQVRRVADVMLWTGAQGEAPHVRVVVRDLEWIGPAWRNEQRAQQALLPAAGA